MNYFAPVLAPVFALACLVFVAQHPLRAQTALVDIGCAPLSVSFTPPAAATSYYWDFQNGVTSTQPNPSTIFVDPGTYVVSFREGIGLPIIGTDTVVVLPRPELGIQPSVVQGCRPLSVDFNNTSVIDPRITISQVSWVFGDGGSADQLSPTHVYNTAGLFTVSLAIVAQEAGCSLTQNFDDLVQVNTLSNINFVTSPNPADVCDPPLTVNFFNVSGQDGLTYQWDLGNGQTFTGLNPPTQTYNTPGTYSVVLTATDSLGCTASRARTLRIRRPEVSIQFPNAVCAGDVIQFNNATVAAGFNWNFPVGSTYSSNTTASPWLIIYQRGTYNISLQITSSTDVNCVVDTSFQIVVNDASADFTSDPSYTCERSMNVNFQATSPQPSEFQWTFADGSTDQGPDVTHRYQMADPTLYGMYGLRYFSTRLIAISPEGCRDTIVQVDSIFAPNALFMPDRIGGCPPLTVAFADSSISQEPIISWTYDFSDGTPQTFSTGDVTHTFLEVGEYPVQLSITNQAGCRDTSYRITIIVDSIPPPPIGPTIPIETCLGVSRPIVFPPPFTDFCSPPFVCDIQSPEPLIIPPSIAPVLVSNGYCIVEYQLASPELTIKGPLAVIDYHIECDQPRRVNFRSLFKGNTSVRWDFGDGQGSTADITIHTFAQTGDYWVKLAAYNDLTDCPISVDSVLVCIRDIQADFDIPEAICVGQTLWLDASASRDVKACCHQGYQWSFDITNRPITTDSIAISQTFGVAGEEVVTLEVQDINGCKDVLRKSIKIYDIYPDFAISDTLICFPATLNFTDLSQADTTLSSWQWNFNPSGASTETNPTYTYTQGNGTDSLIITLVVRDALGCEETFSRRISVYEPTSNISSLPMPANICVGDPLQLQATNYTDGGSFLNFAWDFGNGQTGTGSPASTTYNQSGQYLVTLQFTEASSGCMGTKNLAVSVQGYPEVSFTSPVDTAAVLCYPIQIPFTNTSTADSPMGFFWDFGNGQVSNQANAASAYDKGTFLVQLIASTSHGCRDTFSRSYTTVGPEGELSLSADSICLGTVVTFNLLNAEDVASFEWDFGDGSTANNQSPITHAYELSEGLRRVVLVLRGEVPQCNFVLEDSIQIFDLSADFELSGFTPSDTILCPGTYSFNNLSTYANLFNWDFGNGDLSTQQNPSVNWTVPGEYIVQLIASNSSLACADSLDRTFIIGSLANVSLLSDTICLGDTIQLSLQNINLPGSYNWTPASALIDPPNIPNPRAVPTQTTTYTVDFENVPDCGFSGSAEITVIQPIDWIGIDTIGCIGDSILNLLRLPPNTGQYVFSWQPAPIGVLGEDDINYDLVVNDFFGCFNQVFPYSIEAISDRVNVPNIFSPNGDGRNDVFRVFTELDLENTAQIAINVFKVYNRWGQLVYDGNGPGARWLGDYQGKPAPAEVYLYYIQVDVPKTGASYEFKGEVTLVR